MFVERKLEQLVNAVYEEVLRLYGPYPDKLPTQYIVFKDQYYEQIILPYEEMENLQPLVNQLKAQNPDYVVIVIYGCGVRSVEDLSEKTGKDSILFFATDLRTTELPMYADVRWNGSEAEIGPLMKSEDMGGPAIDPFRLETWNTCTHLPVYGC